MTNLDLASLGAAELDATHGTHAVAEPPRSTFELRWSWLAGALHEVDYGVLLLSDRDRIRFANRAGVVELDSGAALRAVDGRLRAARLSEALALDRALIDAEQRRLRRLLIVGGGERGLGLSVVPLGNASSSSEPSGTVVLLGKRQVCHPLSIAGYSRSHGLTDAESRVLAELCNGSRPQDVARRLAVSISTVRTQIGSIRSKTGTASIVALLAQLAVLPPILVALGRLESPGRPGGAGVFI